MFRRYHVYILDGLLRRRSRQLGNGDQSKNSHREGGLNMPPPTFISELSASLLETLKE